MKKHLACSLLAMYTTYSLMSCFAVEPLLTPDVSLIEYKDPPLTAEQEKMVREGLDIEDILGPFPSDPPCDTGFIPQYIKMDGGFFPISRKPLKNATLVVWTNLQHNISVYLFYKENRGCVFSQSQKTIT